MNAPDPACSTVPHTAEDDAIVNGLGHVAFMAWLIECRDAEDYRRMLALSQNAPMGAVDRMELQGV